MRDPAFPQWLKGVQAMPAEKQVEAVSKKLVELNPGFDGKLAGDHHGKGSPVIANGVVTTLQLNTAKVSDISPLRSLVGLNILYASGDESGGMFKDLSPLEGMQLSILGLDQNRGLSDFTPLKGMPLNSAPYLPPTFQDPATRFEIHALYNMARTGKRFSRCTPTNTLPPRDAEKQNVTQVK